MRTFLLTAMAAMAHGQAEDAITCGGTYTGNTTGATHAVGTPSGEHYYTLNVSEVRGFTFSTCNTANYDTYLRLYAGSHLDATGVEIAAVDDTSGCAGYTQRLAINLQPGEYTLIVEGYSSDEGAYELAVTCGAATTLPPFVSEEITCGSTVTGDTTGAEHVVGVPSGEHFYAVTVTEAQHYTFSTCEGSAFDTRLRLFAGSHLETSSVEIANVDDSCASQSRIEMNLEPGSYTVLVEGYDTDEGAYTLSVACAQVVNPCGAHDDCAAGTEYCDSFTDCYECAYCVNVENDAIDGTCPDHCYAFTTSATEVNATDPPGPSSGALTCDSAVSGTTEGAPHTVGSTSGEHWYTVTVETTMSYSFSTCEGSEYDTRLRLYAGNHLEASGIEIANVDDSCGVQSVVQMILEPGEYTLVIEGFVSNEGPNEGPYTITTSCSPPPEDYTEGVAATCGDSFTGDTTGAEHAAFEPSGEHYYAVTVTEAQQYNFSTCHPNTGFDTVISIFNGSHLVAENGLFYSDDAVGCGLQSMMSLILQPGEYTVVVEGYNTTEGEYNFAITCAPIPEGMCAASSDCEAGTEYCDTRQLCYECAYCVNVENDAIDGTCPDHCYAFTTSATEVDATDPPSGDVSSPPTNPPTEPPVIAITTAAPPTEPPTNYPVGQCPRNCGTSDNGGGTCRPTGVCLSCNDNRLRVNGRCVQSVACRARRLQTGSMEGQNCRCLDTHCHYCNRAVSGDVCRVCRDGWYMLDGQCIESCPAGMTSLGVSQFRRRCLAPFECQRGRIVGQDVNYGCRCATDENTPSTCQFCSFRADEQGQYCTRCLGGTFLYNNRCQAGCDGLLESEGLVSYIPGNYGRECRAPFTCANRLDEQGNACKCSRSVGRNDCQVCDYGAQGATCVRCTGGKFLRNGVCVEDCGEAGFTGEGTDGLECN